MDVCCLGRDAMGSTNDRFALIGETVVTHRAYETSERFLWKGPSFGRFTHLGGARGNLVTHSCL